MRIDFVGENGKNMEFFMDCVRDMHDYCKNNGTGITCQVNPCDDCMFNRICECVSPGIAPKDWDMEYLEED